MELSGLGDNAQIDEDAEEEEPIKVNQIDSKREHAKSQGKPADIRRQMGGSKSNKRGTYANKQTKVSTIQWGANNTMMHDPD